MDPGQTINSKFYKVMDSNKFQITSIMILAARLGYQSNEKKIVHNTMFLILINFFWVWFPEIVQESYSPAERITELARFSAAEYCVVHVGTIVLT